MSIFPICQPAATCQYEVVRTLVETTECGPMEVEAVDFGNFEIPKYVHLNSYRRYAILHLQHLFPDEPKQIRFVIRMLPASVD